MNTNPSIHPAHHIWRSGFAPASRRPTWPLTVVSLIAVAGLCLFLLIMWRQG